jgi:hypothetical protein
MKTCAVVLAAAGIAVGFVRWPDLDWSITLLASSALLVIGAGLVDYLGRSVDQQVADIVDLAEARAARKPYPTEQYGPLAIWDDEMGIE